MVSQPKVKRFLSSDRFFVDGTLLEAWASIKSFRRKDGGDNDASGPGHNAERDFHREKRSNETHRSTAAHHLSPRRSYLQYCAALSTVLRISLIVCNWL